MKMGCIKIAFLIQPFLFACRIFQNNDAVSRDTHSTGHSNQSIFTSELKSFPFLPITKEALNHFT